MFNAGLWVIVMCQCRFILGKKKKNYFLVNDVDHGESYEYMGARGVQEISVASS